MKIQNALNKLAAKFRPKKGKTISYIQPQRIGGKDTYIQPRKTN